MVLWDLEWFDADGTPLQTQHGLDRETAESQAQRWLQATPGSRVYLYRRRGETSVLVEIFTATEQERAN